MAELNVVPLRKLVDSYTASFCANGHVVEGSQVYQGKAWVIMHSCGNWTWEDGNYCTCCGGRLREEEAHP